METTSPAWLPAMTRMVMAGDESSREWADEGFACGTPWQQAVWYVGSFSRIAWLRDLEEAGEISRTELYAEWLDLWSGSDPDDTDPWALVVWQEAKEWTGGILTDTHDELPGDMVVYRGQHDGDPLGISWSLDPDVAYGFARGKGIRAPMPDGIVITGLVDCDDVLAYITDRNEAEVVVDPRLVALLPD